VRRNRGGIHVTLRACADRLEDASDGSDSAAPRVTDITLQNDFALVERDAGTLKRRSVRGAAATLLAQGARLGLQFGAQIALARLLQPSAFGLVAMVTPITGFMQIFNDMGLVQATVQRPTISQQELSALFWINLAVSVVLAAGLMSCAPLVAWFYRAPPTAPITAALASLLMLGGLSAQPAALMNRTLRFGPLAVIDVASAVAAAVVGISAALAGGSYWSLVAMQAANSLTVVILAWVFAGWRPSRPRWTPGVLAMLHFGGHVTAYNVVNYFAYNVDKVLIGVTWGDVGLGFYDRACRLMMMPMLQVTTPFTRVAVPLLSRLIDDPERYRAAYSRAIRAVLLTSCPGIMFAVVLAHPLIVAVLGARWAETAPMFAWLGGGALIAPVGMSLSWLFISQGRASEQFLWCCVSAVVLVASFLAGLPWGPVGVAAAWTIVAWSIQVPLVVRAATRDGPVRVRDLVHAVYPVLIVAIATLVGLWLMEPRLAGMGRSGLLLGLIGAYAAVGCMLACWPEGKRVLRDVWALQAMFRDGTS
jgi:polysaccharide transporter, PST family